MYVDVTVGQWNYLSQTSKTYFGPELMAVVFSLPWALLMWSCVISCIPAFLLWNHVTLGQDVNVLHSAVPLLLEYFFSRVTHSYCVSIGRVACLFVGVRLDHLGIQRYMDGVAGWLSSSFTHFSCAGNFASLMLSWCRCVIP